MRRPPVRHISVKQRRAHARRTRQRAFLQNITARLASLRTRLSFTSQLGVIAPTVLILGAVIFLIKLRA